MRNKMACSNNKQGWKTARGGGGTGRAKVGEIGGEQVRDEYRGDKRTGVKTAQEVTAKTQADEG